MLQHILREKAEVKKGNLEKEIEQILASDTLPSDLAEDLDVVRNLGNLAAHTTKTEDGGVVVDVEPGEAEWLLNVVEDLLDLYFVRPASRARKRDSLGEKLKKAGKPPLKERSQGAAQG